MSRIGNLPILIPDGVTVEKAGRLVVVKGPKGELNLNLDPKIGVLIDGLNIFVKRKNDQKATKALHGLFRAILANMIKGVTDGWSKTLELVGVGFRAQSSDGNLSLTVGFSHSVEIKALPGIQFEVSDNTKIKILGIDKQLVGQVAAKIRAIKPPEPYKGKGIRYEGEYIRRKAGKTRKLGGLGG